MFKFYDIATARELVFEGSFDEAAVYSTGARIFKRRRLSSVQTGIAKAMALLLSAGTPSRFINAYEKLPATGDENDLLYKVSAGVKVNALNAMMNLYSTNIFEGLALGMIKHEPRIAEVIPHIVTNWAIGYVEKAMRNSESNVTSAVSNALSFIITGFYLEAEPSDEHRHTYSMTIQEILERVENHQPRIADALMVNMNHIVITDKQAGLVPNVPVNNVPRNGPGHWYFG